MGEAFKYNESDTALIEEATLPASQSTCEKSVFTVSQQSHGEKKENKGFIENVFNRTTHKTDPEEKCISQKSSIRKKQHINIESTVNMERISTVIQL